MTLTVDFSGLKKRLKEMGAEPAVVPLSIPKNPWRGGIIEGGKDLLDDIEVVGPDRLLILHGDQITINILEYKVDEYTLRNSPRKAQKFHFCYCSKIEEMKNQDRFERYVVSKRTSNLFRAKPYNRRKRGFDEGIDVPLYPCRLCLKQINYEGFAFLDPWDELKKRRIVKNFDVDAFFNKYKSVLPPFKEKPRYGAEDAPPDDYTEDWPEISQRYRRSKNWICESCGVDCSQDTDLLDAHHKNGIKRDNKTSNLQALCKLCHTEQPYHDMDIFSDQKRRIRELRQAQGLAR